MKALLTLVGIAAFLGVPLANATIEMRIIDSGPGGGDTGWVQCNSAGLVVVTGTNASGALLCSNASQGTFTGSVGNYSLSTDTTTRGDPSNPFLDLNYSANTLPASAGGTVTTPGDLIIESMGDTYTTTVPEFELVGNGNGTFTSTAVQVAGYESDANNFCPAGVNPCTPPSAAPASTIITDTFPATTNPNSYNVVLFSAAGNSATPYSLGLSYSISAPSGAPGSSLSGDIQLDAVPEPAAVTLFGAVLLFTVTAIRRKVRRTA